VIKVNLLESMTDRSVGVAFVEDKVSSARTQTLLLGLTVMALVVLGVGYEYVSTNRQHEAAVKELATQTRINDQMNAVKREQADLEKAGLVFNIAETQSFRDDLRRGSRAEELAPAAGTAARSAAEFRGLLERQLAMRETSADRLHLARVLAFRRR